MGGVTHHLVRSVRRPPTNPTRNLRSEIGFHPAAAFGSSVDSRRAPSAEALLLAEAIASAADLYFVGRVLPNVPDAEFVASQVPAMGDAARNAGLADDAFEALIEEVVAAPERAFEDLRALLFDVATALVPCRGVSQADAVLARFAGHRFEPILHHFELSNWVLYARAHGARPGEPDEAVRAIDRALRGAADPIAWLATSWVAPAADG